MTKNIAIVFLLSATLAACSNDNAAGGTDGGLDSGNGGSGGGQGTGGKGGTGGENGGTGGMGMPDGSVHQIDRSHLKDTGTTGKLDYSDPALWVCLPGNDPNECRENFDATEILKDNSTKIDKHVFATDPPFDCFYVYPTVALGGNGNMTDFSNIDLVLDPLLSQAGRFTRLCEVYAPLYRQVALSIPSTAPSTDGGAGDAGKPDAAPGDAGKMDGGSVDAGPHGEAGAADGSAVGITGDPMLAYGDVKAAFDYYMAHYNKGRKFVLMGHSQGTAMLTQLVKDEFDDNADLRKQLISALLIGGSIQVPVGKDVGGTFQNIPLCTKPAQTGCVIAYNSFAASAPPPANSLFGKGTQAGWMNACTNPAVLAGNSGNYRGSYFPVKFYDAIFAPDAPANMVPDVTTPYRLWRDLFTGKCKNENGFSYLEISPNQSSDDKRPVPPYRTTSSETLGFGMHIADYSVELDDLIDAVDQQAKAAM